MAESRPLDPIDRFPLVARALAQLGPGVQPVRKIVDAMLTIERGRTEADALAAIAAAIGTGWLRSSPDLGELGKPPKPGQKRDERTLIDIHAMATEWGRAEARNRAVDLR